MALSPTIRIANFKKPVQTPIVLKKLASRTDEARKVLRTLRLRSGAAKVV